MKKAGHECNLIFIIMVVYEGKCKKQSIKPYNSEEIVLNFASWFVDLRQQALTTGVQDETRLPVLAELNPQDTHLAALQSCIC